MSQRIGLIWAEAHDRVIGAGGTMPWHLSEDLRRFKRVTMGSPVIMGRRTWESFGSPPRPLPGRANIVITSDEGYEAPGATLVRSLDEALAAARAAAPDVETIWVIGGGQVYRAALDIADTVERTEIDVALDGDTTAPELGPEWVTTVLDPEHAWHATADGLRYRFRTLERVAASDKI